MNLAIRARHLAAAAVACVMLLSAMPSMAQEEISESHLKAARDAITALHATEEFDQILPQAAAALKAELTQKNPDLVALISTTVDEKALALAGRRGDLEREAAKIYARVFSEKELNEISAFYNTDTGKKLLSDGNIVGREVLEAAGIWQRGVARDLAQAVAEHLQSVTSAKAPADGQAEGQSNGQTEGQPQQPVNQ
jgi:hypothetical protein